MYNKPAPVATAGVTCKVIPWTGDWGPQVGVDQRGGWPSGNQRLNQTPKSVRKVTPQSPPSWMLKPGCIGGPTNWICPVGGWNLQPSQGWKTHGNLPRRSGPPSQFQRSEAGSSQGNIILHPPAPKCLTWNVFLPDELSYQDVLQQPFLLTVAYAQGLQYWAEKLNWPEVPDFCPLVRNVIELRQRVKEHVIFTKWDII